jgi:small acid-soluble spore protein D (minor alpha/beta-type SASP)
MARNNNQLVVPEAKGALESLKYEVANSIGVNLKKGYNGDLTSKQNGSVGGEMVRRMIESYERTGK